MGAGGDREVLQEPQAPVKETQEGENKTFLDRLVRQLAAPIVLGLKPKYRMAIGKLKP